MNPTIKAALLKLGICLWAMLHDFLTSKKVLTAALTTVVGALVKDPATRDHVIEVGVVLLAAQGATDLGKAAKKADVPQGEPLDLARLVPPDAPAAEVRPQVTTK